MVQISPKDNVRDREREREEAEITAESRVEEKKWKETRHGRERRLRRKEVAMRRN